MAKSKYFDGKVSAGFLSIYTSRVIARISLAMMGLFIPIFLYELFGFNLSFVLAYYMLDYIVYFILVPLGTKLSINTIGIRRSLTTSTLWIVLYYIIFFLASKHMPIGQDLSFPGLIFSQTGLFVILTIIFLNLRRLTFWVPLQTDLTAFTDKKNRGKEMSLMEASSIFLGAIMPAVAGWVLFAYNYDLLFAISIFIFIISVLPLLTLPQVKEQFSWKYWQTFKELFAKTRRKTVLAFVGDGAENVFSAIIWPIFIWEILNGNYLYVGFLSSLIVVVSVTLQLFVGKLSDKGKKDKVLKYGTALYALGWIVKIFIETAFQIFVVSTYHNLTRVFTRAPFDTLNYEKAADQGHYVDEYTAVHELAITGGRILVIAIILIIYPIIGVNWTFLLGAIAALLMNFLVNDELIDAGRHSG